MMDRVQTERVLRSLGWFPGRCDDRVDGWERQLAAQGNFVMHPAARSFLHEFGGLARRKTVPPAARAFTFDIDPTLASWEKDRFDTASFEVEDALYPAGEAINGHEFIAIGTDGHVYLVMDMVHHLASDAWVAFSKLIPDFAHDPGFSAGSGL